MKLALLGVLMTMPVLAADRLVEGNPAATVRMIVYEDLQCSDCAAFRKMLDEKLLPKYGQLMAVEHRDFPLPKHKWATPASIASRYFQRQEPKLAIIFRRWAMAGQASIDAENFQARLVEFAKANGVDGAKAVAALADERLQKLVQADFDEAVARGVARTPTVFVDGEPFIETFTVEEISKGIEDAVARARR